MKHNLIIKFYYFIKQYKEFPKKKEESNQINSFEPLRKIEPSIAVHEKNYEKTYQ